MLLSEGLARKWSRPNQGTIAEFASRDWRKSCKTSVLTTHVLAKIQNKRAKYGSKALWIITTSTNSSFLFP
jgi:hypothetical protein